jgi:hypothetical protein
MRSGTGTGGAVRLRAYDEGLRALLIEQCDPGSQLWTVEDDEEATSIGATVLSTLWRQPDDDHGFVALAAVAARWAVEISRDWEALGRPFAQGLLAEAVDGLSRTRAGPGRVRGAPSGLPQWERLASHS